MRIIVTKTDNDMILLLTADLGHYLGIKQHINMILILCSMIALSSQMVYYYSHSIGVKPTFVRVFQLLSGSITPSRIGLNEAKQVKPLLKIAKWLSSLQKNNAIFFLISVFFFVFGVHFYSLSFLTSIILTIYPAINFSLLAYYAYNMLSVQIVLFFILCKYFLVKLKELNATSKQTKRMNTNRFGYIVKTFDDLYREIDEYNANYCFGL